MNSIGPKLRFSRLIVPLCIPMLCVAGCVEPGYRNEVTTNSEGAVEVHRVPKDAPTAQTAAPSQGFAAPAQSAPAPALQDSSASIDDRIAGLQAQVDKLNVEITKLQLQKAAGGASK